MRFLPVKWLFVSLVAVWLPQFIHSARILGYFPSPSNSHLIIHCSVAETLANAGHDVTVISNLPNINKQARYKYIMLEGPQIDQNFTGQVVSKAHHMYRTFGPLIKTMSAMANETLSHPIMQRFLKEHGEGSFDLLILSFFMNDFNLGLAAHFKCPVVLNFMFRPVISLNGFVGNPLEVSYVPLVFTAQQQPLDFFGRVKNLLAYIFENVILEAYLNYRSNQFYDYHFSDRQRYPPLAEMRKNVSLLLVNHHTESQGPIRPNVPALIEIGGIQIKEKPNPLPTDLLGAIAQYDKGFIYLSLGSIVRGKFLDPAKLKAMYEVLSQLPYLVLWKWTDEEVLGSAPNVLFKSWLPQDDLLAHPKCKLFITHGGQGSVVESQYHGVPMLGMPFFGDQPGNVQQFVKAGFGLSLDFKRLDQQSFSDTLNKLLTDATYAQNVQRFSQLYRDRPHTSREKLVYWIEYVIRHRGAKHLQSPLIHLNFIQRHSLDAAAFIVGLLACLLFGLVLWVKWCVWLLKPKPKMASSKKKNK